MHIKITDDAEVYQTAKYGKSIGRIVLNVQQDEIVDADAVQQARFAIKPRIIEDVVCP